MSLGAPVDPHSHRTAILCNAACILPTARLLKLEIVDYVSKLVPHVNRELAKRPYCIEMIKAGERIMNHT